MHLPHLAPSRSITHAPGTLIRMCVVCHSIAGGIPKLFSCHRPVAGSNNRWRKIPGRPPVEVNQYVHTQQARLQPKAIALSSGARRLRPDAHSTTATRSVMVWRCRLPRARPTGARVAVRVAHLPFSDCWQTLAHALRTKMAPSLVHFLTVLYHGPCGRETVCCQPFLRPLRGQQSAAGARAGGPAPSTVQASYACRCA